MVFADQPNKSKNIESIYPLSPMQEGMLFHSLYEPESGVYFEQFSFTVHGNLDVSAFELAWRQVVERHPALRTLFVWKNRTKQLQVVLKKVSLPWTNLDWRELSPVEQEDQLEVFLQAARNKGFELDKAPLMRCALIQLAEETYKFVWSFHHLLIDGWSVPIIFKEVFAFYEALKTGFDLYLPPTRPYSDYIAWLQQQDKSIAIAYWQDALQGFTAPTPLVVDRTVRPNSQQKKTHLEHDLRSSATTTATLKSLAQKHHLTLSTFVQGAWALLLSRYSGEEDVVFGATVSGRPPALSGVESMVGLFINTLPARVQVESESKLLPWLMQLQQHQVEREQYSYSSLSEIQRLSEIPPGSSLFESIVVFENYPYSDSLLSPSDGLQIYNLQAIKPTNNYPLTLVVIPERELSMQIIYDYERFSADTIARMGNHLLALLEGMVATESQKLKDLPLLTSAESHQLLVEWNNTTKEYPFDKCIHELFEEQVTRSPDAIAVVFEGEQLSYLQLNQRANQLAHYLRTLGVEPEVLVGICVERSLEMVVSLLGILKAGGAYLPLDPALPKESLAFRLQDAQVPILLTQKGLLKREDAQVQTVLYLDADWELIAQESEVNSKSEVIPENLAYVLYTSGSTGQPKGVVIEHRQILNYLHAILDKLQLPTGASFATVSTFAADLGNTAIFPALCTGRCLHIVSQERATDPKALTEYFQHHPIDCLKITPAHLATLLASNASGSILPRQCLVLGGEAASWDLIEKIQQETPNCRILNHYGPTETTVGVLTYPVSSKQANYNSKTVPIGRPIANTQVYILDRHQQPVSIGVSGELHIGGASLARGYLNDLDLTAENFISNPFNDRTGTHLYKTGDLARYLPDGNIEFLGRIDNQVKIRGFRIELGEIEAAIAQHQAVRETVVIVREDIPGDKRLVAYIVPIQVPPTCRELRHFLQQKLPSYMVPNVIVVLSAMPLTPNGKVDRRALPAPDSSPSDSRGFVPPRDAVEIQLQRIWSEVLQHPTVGVHDNFFELGGHSLLAVRLMAQIQQHFEKNLPLATLLASPTIEQLASCLRANADSFSWSPLVAIQSGGDKRPFFFVPGVGGNVIYLYELARHLGLDQPFYGFSAKGLDGEEEPLIRVEDIAAYYIKAMQTLQPTGPYLLGGHSFGGVVAFEMAQQLRKMGHEVALVAIIDALAPIVGNKPNCSDEEEAANLFDFASYIEYMFSLNLEVSKETLADLTAEEQLHYLKERLIRVNLLPPDAGIRLVRGLVQVYMASLKAHRAYLPSGVLPTRIALFRAQDIDEKEGDISELFEALKEPTLGWREMSGTVDVHLVPGNHMTMMAIPHVQVLAEQLQVALEQVQTHLVSL